MLLENWADQVIEAQRISDRIILLKLIIGKAVFTLLLVYTPQVGWPELEKEHFYGQLQYAVAKVSASEILIPVGDWNSHVGTPAGVFCNAHGGHGFGPCNAEGGRILEFAIANSFHVSNTWFKKRDTYLITCSTRGDSAQIDHILYYESFNSAVSNMKVIPNEECIKTAQYSSVWLYHSCPQCEEMQDLALHINLEAQGPSCC